MTNRHKYFWVIGAIIILGVIYAGFYYNNNYDSTTVEITLPINESDDVSSKAKSVSESNENTSPDTAAPVTAYITSIEKTKVTLDYIEVLSGDRAREVAVADGKCTREEIEEYNCLPNAIYDRNINSKLRTFTISPTVKVIISSAFEKNPTGRVNMTIQEFINYNSDKDIIGSYNPYEVGFNENGEVSLLEEMFRP
jgi:hypothetical protein